MEIFYTTNIVLFISLNLFSNRLLISQGVGTAQGEKWFCLTRGLAGCVSQAEKDLGDNGMDLMRPAESSSREMSMTGAVTWREMSRVDGGCSRQGRRPRAMAEV